MIKTFLLSILLVASLKLHAQATYDLSLKVDVRKTELQHSIVQVIDGRKDKTHVGWVQTGITNKRRVALLKDGFESEIVGLLKRSGYIDSVSRENGLIISVARLYVNELTQAMSETGRAELHLHFFEKVSSDSARYLTSINVADEHSGMDVTHRHDDNIAEAFAKAFVDFHKWTGRGENRAGKKLAIASISDASFVLRDLTTLAILNNTEFKDGLYQSFEEFLTNSPSITDGFEVKYGKTIKLFRVSATKSRTRVKSGVYGFAHQNKIYILFNNEFFEVERHPASLQFVAIMMPDPNAVATGAVLGGAIGGAIAASAADKLRKRFEIDFDSGIPYELGIEKR